jgi:hypothetical protein
LAFFVEALTNSIKKSLSSPSSKSIHQEVEPFGTPEKYVASLSEDAVLSLLKHYEPSENASEGVSEEAVGEVFSTSAIEVETSKAMSVLKEPIPISFSESDHSDKAIAYRANLDTRMSSILSLVLGTDGRPERMEELVTGGLALGVLEMWAHSSHNSGATLILLTSLRRLAVQPLTIEQMLLPKFNFVPALVALLKSPSLSVRTEASVLIALLTVIKEMLEPLRKAGVIPMLIGILSNDFQASEQALYNNGVVILVRLLAISHESFIEEMKSANVVIPLCNVIKKLDRSPAVHEAVITLLSVLAAPIDLTLQIIATDIIPSLVNILRAYVKSHTGKKARRSYIRITQPSTGTRPVLSADEEAIVDDEDAISDSINPVYQGSDPEDIVTLIRMLSRDPGARAILQQEMAIPCLVELIANPSIPFLQKIQAVSCLNNFAGDSRMVPELLAHDLGRSLTHQTGESGTSKDEIDFQDRAIIVLANLAAHEPIQKYTSQKAWINPIMARASKTQHVPVSQAIAVIFRELLKNSDRQEDVRDLFASSDFLKATIGEMVKRELEMGGKGNLWASVNLLI